MMMMEGRVNILNIFSTLARNEAATLRKGMSAAEIRWNLGERWLQKIKL